MKVFISHSMKDVNLLNALRSIAQTLGIEPLIAEHQFDATNTISQKVENMIQQSDLVLAVLTSDGIGSGFVQQEIGFAHGRKSLLILVESGLENQVSGFMYGRDRVVIDPWNPQPALEQIHSVLAAQKQKSDQQEAIGKLILVGVGILFFAALTSR
ncbi:MAG: nucleotide-binding protein [Bacteroidetes bacterium]|nr:nucleotide-binding protein [Bacteroidota bacterium]